MSVSPSISPYRPPPPPPPPTLPIPRNKERPEKKAPIVLKTRGAPAWMLPVSKQERKPPPTGTYFFYGTLQDPDLLSEILCLTYKPVLQPARIAGCGLKLWGQYPALVDSPGEGEVKGVAYEVVNAAVAERLQEYETSNYAPQGCEIRVENGNGGDMTVNGFTFMFCGRQEELSDGTFDLKTWLGRMGRLTPGR